MIYSYIKPRKKSLFTPELQLLSVFFGITVFMLLGTYLFLLFKDYRFTQDRLEIIELREETAREIELIEKSIVFIQEEKVLSETIFTKNTVLKDSISNMFDLVPQRITLSEAKLLEDGLILYGITPNKDIYNFMLQAPLRSIFHRTYSSFHPAQNGWLHFVSTNYVDKEEETLLKPQEEKTANDEEETEYEE
ncbi:MAG: hypothetical protein H8E76_03480 [Helicobacteraceae bacterium]|nr:hypothetical protein [Candidatus Sulfurimonas ponti]MBL6973607.1 hypothetical protein [Sulfurimonas sp.]